MHSTTIASALLSLAAVARAAPTLQPRDSNPGCNANSVGKFAWTLSGFVNNASWTFSTPSHQIASGAVDFELANPALTYPVSCHAIGTQLQDFFYGTVDYDCTLPEGTEGSAETSFSYNYPTGQVIVHQKWTCSDADPKYPTTFFFTGDVNLTASCSETDYTNPNWEEGQIYSSKTRSCTAATTTFVPTEISAIA